MQALRSLLAGLYIFRASLAKAFLPWNTLCSRRTERIQALAAKRAEARQIDPILVVTRKEADSLAVHAINRDDLSSNPLMKGWRHELLTPTIEAVCADFARLKKK